MNEEVLDAELLDESTTKALTAQRDELQKVPGSALFMAALTAFLNESEEQVKVGLRGIKTFTVSAEAILGRRLNTEDDYKACVAFSLDAGKREKAVLDAFSTGTGFFYAFHRALTGLRAMGSGPWGTIKSKLERHAAAWYLEQDRLKKDAAAKLAQSQQRVKSDLERQAEEKMASGYIAEGEALLREADMASAPITLPDAAPKVEGSRTAPKWKITVRDIKAVARAVADGKVELMHAVKSKGKKETEDRPLLTVDESVIRALLGRMEAAEVMRRIPGILIEEDVAIYGTGRK